MRTFFSTTRLARLALLAGCTLLPASLRAQNDSSMMSHDSGAMSKDHEMMGQDSMMGHDSMAADMMFMGAGEHKAAGDYTIEEKNGKQQITLTADFAVEPAGDTWLVLANGDAPDAGSVYVAKLKSPKGAQAYTIPKGTDLSKYAKLLVWSKKSKSLLASTDLSAGGTMMKK
jgi:Electron transfer DM13